MKNKVNAPMVQILNNEPGIAQVILDNAKNYNALSFKMLMELKQVIAKIKKDPSIRVVILKGAGKGFCAGHDLKEIQANFGNKKFYKELIKLCVEVMSQIRNLPQPVIAQVHGVATAAGCQLVATCDLAVASQTAEFGTPGVLIGLFCSTPMVPLARTVAPKHALELLLTGQRVTAQEALAMGLINQVAPESKLEAQTLELAKKISIHSNKVTRGGKKTFYQQLELTEAKAYQKLTQVMIQNLLAPEAQEGITAFIEKRNPRWE